MNYNSCCSISSNCESASSAAECPPSVDTLPLVTTSDELLPFTACTVHQQSCWPVLVWRATVWWWCFSTALVADGVRCVLCPFSRDEVPSVDLGVRSRFKREEFCFGSWSVDTTSSCERFTDWGGLCCGVSCHTRWRCGVASPPPGFAKNSVAIGAKPHTGTVRESTAIRECGELWIDYSGHVCDISRWALSGDREMLGWALCGDALPLCTWGGIEILLW